MLATLAFFSSVSPPPEILSANPNNDVPSPVIHHDILEVNKYFMSGLIVSPIDKWFMGPVPHFNPRDLGINNGSDSSLSDVLKRTRDLLDNTKQMAWRPVCAVLFTG